MCRPYGLNYKIESHRTANIKPPFYYFYNMDYSAQFISVRPTVSSTEPRKGGLLLKGKTRSDRQPVHMNVLVDTSGSMDLENKLESVKRSLQVMLVLLSDQDRLSLISFDDRSKVILNKAIPTQAERDAISYRISSLVTNGSTNMSAGLLEGRELIEPSSSGRKQGLLLLTDGHANIGVHDTPGLVAIVKRILEEHPDLSITTVGYGVDHNADLLTEIAKHGGGAYNVVKDLQDVAGTFGDVLGGLSSVSAQRISVEFPAGYRVQTSYPTTSDPDGTTHVNIGDLYAETEIVVLFEGTPALMPIRVKGTDLTTLNTIDATLVPSETQEEGEYPLSFIIAEYRTLVAEILRKFRARLVQAPEVRTLLETIRANTRIADHPITAFLIEDLEQILAIAATNRNMTQEEETVMAQHSAYIGISRGLRTVTGPSSQAHRNLSPPRHLRLQRQVGIGTISPTLTAAVSGLASPDAVDLHENNQTPPRSPTDADARFLSPMANAHQQRMISLMRTMSNQP